MDYAAGSWEASAAPKRQARRNSKISGHGAVRLSQEPAPKSRHLGKCAAGLVFAAGGILVTTAVTGTVEQPPRLTMAAAAITPPAFFFDDTADALTELTLDTRALPGVAVHTPKDTIGKQMALSEHVPGASLASLSATDLPEVEADTASAVVTHPSLAALRERQDAPATATTDIYKVASGDTLSGLLSRFGIKGDQMPQVLTDDAVKKHLSSLRIGQQLDVTRLESGEFHSLSAKVGQNQRVTIRRAENGFAVAAIDLPVEKERVVSSGTIEQSLYLAAEQADLKQSTIMELADIFQWELNFARDIRTGDQFSVVYDRLYREGRYIGDGDILAAEFIRGNKHYQAVRFTTDDGTTGYYSPDGRSKRRTFNRHPVDVVRITSKFDLNRMHPVLGEVRAHRGVDYGAPHGSPIRATADGTVHYSGNKGAYGNTVILRHGQNVDTLYAHMSKIDARSVVGKRVRQGDIIGYVGRTGRVTGTHLHYEFRKRGLHVDPLLVELPAADPLPDHYRADLRIISNQMIAQMRSVVPEVRALASASD